MTGRLVGLVPQDPWIECVKQSTWRVPCRCGISGGSSIATVAHYLRILGVLPGRANESVGRFEALEKTVAFVLDHAIALACMVLQRAPVEHLDHAMPVMDHRLALQFA